MLFSRLSEWKEHLTGILLAHQLLLPLYSSKLTHNDSPRHCLMRGKQLAHQVPCSPTTYLSLTLPNAHVMRHSTMPAILCEKGRDVWIKSLGGEKVRTSLKPCDKSSIVEKGKCDIKLAVLAAGRSGGYWKRIHWLLHTTRLYKD